jgi:uncharacterized protein (TIGR02118 family)
VSAKLIAMYRHPADPAAFDRYYFERHWPLARTLPGLRSYEVSRGGVQGLSGPADIYLIATLGFDSMASVQSALQSDEGQRVAADLAAFAGAGVDIVFFECEILT